jgi:hypothetical protein
MPLSAERLLSTLVSMIADNCERDSIADDLRRRFYRLLYKPHHLFYSFDHDLGLDLVYSFKHNLRCDLGRDRWRALWLDLF